jgi:hypothetical protein
MSNSAGPKITKNGLVLDFDAANPKSYNFYADSYASSVSLYLQMNGANGSTTFTDSSPNALTVTAAGNAQISTTQSKYNGSAGYFDGNGDTLTIPANAVFALGTGDYTIEGWFYSLTSGTSQRGMIDFRTATTGTNGLMLRENDGGFLVYLNNATILSTTTGRVANQWQHVALVRQGTTVTLYVDGVSQTTATSSTNLTDNIMRISGFIDTQSSVYAYNGYIDNLKITKGVARYTSAFTSPPIPSTCTDLTRSKNVGTLTNGVDYNFSNGGSLVFDGSNDYVKAPFNSNYNFGSGDFTVSAWINMTVLPSNNWSSFVTHGVSGSAQRWVFYYDTRSSQSSPGLRFTSVNASNAVNIDISVGSTSGWSAGIWYYVTITRVGNVFTLYRNGVQVGNTVTDTDAIVDVTSNGLYLGMENTGVDAPLNGKISLVQIYKAKGLTSTEVYNNFVANRGRFGV